MRKFKKGTPVEIHWIDSFYTSYAWKDESEIKKNDRCILQSIGYYFHKSKDHVIISRDRGEGQRSGVFYIPSGCIKKIRRVRP